MAAARKTCKPARCPTCGAAQDCAPVLRLMGQPLDSEGMDDAHQATDPKGSQKTETATKKRRRKRLPNWLRPAEAESLVATAAAVVAAARTQAKRKAATRDLLMIRCGLGGGFRVSELCNLQVTELDLAEGAATVLHGKGDKDRVVPLPAKLLPDLAAWLGGRTGGYIFAGTLCDRLAERTFQRRLKALASKAGVIRRIHPHVLRHSFAVNLLHSGADIMEIKELLGHSSIGTTQVYLAVDANRMRAAVNRLPYF